MCNHQTLLILINYHRHWSQKNGRCRIAGNFFQKLWRSFQQKNAFFIKVWSKKPFLQSNNKKLLTSMPFFLLPSLEPSPANHFMLPFSLCVFKNKIENCLKKSVHHNSSLSIWVWRKNKKIMQMLIGFISFSSVASLVFPHFRNVQL